MSIRIGRSARVTLNRGMKLTVVSEYSPLIDPIGGTPLTLTFNYNGTNSQNWFVQGSSNFNMTVRWGDGSTNNYTSADNYQPSHVYTTAGNYTALVTFSDPTVITNLDISTGYGNNRLQSITGLDILSSSLSSLILGGNQLTSFSSASGLTSQSVLNILDLSYNSLFTFGTTLPDSLTDLYLNNNSLGNFNPATPLPMGLINLYLNSNLLNNFNPSYPLPYSLQTLNLSNNQLPTFIPSQTLPSGLSTLDLSYNYITTFQPTGSFPNGNSYLYLNNNNMSSTNISNALTYLSSSVSNWVAPNNIVLWNQTGGGCISNPTTAYSAIQYLESQGWTVDYDVCANIGLRTFYISDTDGDDTRTVTQAQNPATPWKTMRKVEQFGNGSLGSYPNKAAAGDVFRFKSGDTFYCSDRSFGGFRWWGGTYGSSPSGTAANPIVFTSYGSGDKPNFLFPNSTTVLEAWDKVVFHFEGISYVIFDGLQFNDPRSPVTSPQNPYTQYKVGGAATGQAIFLGEADLANGLLCNNNIVKNCYTNNIGYGISVCGNDNLFTNNYFENFGQMYPFTDASYGQISVQITGDNNVVTYNTIKGGWAWAETFSWNGGAIEFVDASNNTTVMYNTIIDCNDVMELGKSSDSHIGETISNILFAYNKVINCGGLAYVNPLITGSNIQIYNNVVVENSLSRFSGTNFASGAQDFPTYQPGSCPKLPYPSATAISYNSAQNTYTGSILYDIKNNVFNYSNAPVTVANDYTSPGVCNTTRTYTLSVVSSNTRTSYRNNIYKISNGSTIGHTLGTGELSTTTQLFADITGNNPELWNYYPLPSSLLINNGTNVGLTKDFNGVSVNTPPEVGILEFI